MEKRINSRKCIKGKKWRRLNKNKWKRRRNKAVKDGKVSLRNVRKGIKNDGRRRGKGTDG